MRAILCPISAAELNDLYTNQKLTDQDIVTRLGQGATLKRVRAWRKRFGIETLPRWSRNEIPPIEGKLRSMLVGSMLGDGRLVRRTHATHYTECHAANQEAYLRWKADLWGPWVLPDAVKPVVWETGGQSYDGFRFNTVAHADLNPWQDLFYKGRKGWKRLLPDVVDLVDEFALTIWYLDDGHAGWWPGISFGADEPSRQVAWAIFEKFGLKPRWQLSSGKTGTFHMEREDTAHRFIELVTQHVPKCMNSKLADFGFQGPQYQVRQRLTRELLLDGVSKEIPLRHMSRDLGVSVTAIKSALDRHEIEYATHVGRPKGKKVWLSQPLAPVTPSPQLAEREVERMSRLVRGGLTTSQIADILQVSRSTVLLRLKEADVQLKTGPKTSLTVEASESLLGSKYPDTGLWKGLGEVEQESWTADILEVLLKTEFPFPVPFDSEGAEKELARVKKSQVGITSWSPVGLRVCNSLFPNRFRALYKSRVSAWEGWHDEKHLRRAINFQLRVGDPVVPRRVLRALTANCRTPSVFRPVVAKYIYETYCPAGGRVWDPCSGYGGRLLGALAAGVRYVASEIEPETVQGNLRLAELLGMSDQVEVHEARAEGFDPGPVDLVFTSPPYYNVELYGQAVGQSSLQNPTFEGWVESFLVPVIQRAWDRLPVGGALVLNLTDVKEGRKVYPLVERTVQEAVGIGFTHEDTLAMPLASLNRRKGASEPMLVFRR